MIRAAATLVTRVAQPGGRSDRESPPPGAAVDEALDRFGRNLWFDETDDTNALVRLARQLELDRKLAAIRDAIGRDVAVQGEVIGPLAA